MKSLMITAIFVAASASAEVFSWKKATTHSGNTLPDNPEWSSFGDADNWATGTDKSGCNSAGRAPGKGDDIYYGASGSDFFCFDLDGTEYIVRNLDNGDMNWVAHRMLVRNGSLTFTGSFTNTWQQVHVFKDGKFTLSPMSSGRFARGGNASLFAVYDGGELDLAGPHGLEAGHADLGAGLQLGGVLLGAGHVVDEVRAVLIRGVDGDLVVPPGLVRLHVALDGDLVVDLGGHVVGVAHDALGHRGRAQHQRQRQDCGKQLLHGFILLAYAACPAALTELLYYKMNANPTGPRHLT